MTAEETLSEIIGIKPDQTHHDAFMAFDALLDPEPKRKLIYAAMERYANQKNKSTLSFKQITAMAMQGLLSNPSVVAKEDIPQIGDEKGWDKFKERIRIASCAVAYEIENTFTR